MARLRADFVRGTITNNPLAIGDTTLTSASLASLPVVSSPDICVLILDPGSSAPEVVYVTAHSSAATTATISRGQEGSSAKSHIQGTAFAHGATGDDFEGASIAATGVTDGYVLTADGAGAAAWEALSAPLLVASSVTPTATTSTSAVDLVTLSGLSIPVTSWVEITVNWRKDASAANAVGFGLKVNSTVVLEAAATNPPTSSATQRAENGVFQIILGPRATDYQAGINGWSRAWVSSSGAIAVGSSSTADYLIPALTALVPIATITSLAIRAINGTASNNAEITSVRVVELK